MPGPNGVTVTGKKDKETLLMGDFFTGNIVAYADKKLRVVAKGMRGADAVEVFTGHSGEFDLVVTDVVMPEMGGREFMQTVASSHPEMKVLYMSGHIADEELQDEIVKDGVPFLSKPFKPSELTKKILEVLDGS